MNNLVKVISKYNSKFLKSDHPAEFKMQFALAIRPKAVTTTYRNKL
jgi:hypothetical protein